jgi:peptidoglycan/LPS O-acetylase OafA/YrhL
VKHAGAYDCIRLLAAAMVLLSHSYVLAGDPGGEPLARLTGGAHDLGEIAVNLFFAMSGYLVAQSWQRDPDFRRFLLRRTLRIAPGLAAVVLGCALVVGPIFSTLDTTAYFAAPRTWLYLTKITAMPALQGLPGVFDATPYPGVVNGSLWSLRLEVLCYVGLALLGALAWKRATKLVVIAMAAVAAADLALSRAGLGLSAAAQGQAAAYLLNSLIFLLGILVARIGLPERPLRLGGPALIAAIALLWWRAASIPFAIALGLAAIGCGAGLRCSVHRQGDWSYGLYLWAFPVQQMAMSLWPGLAPLGLFARALPATLLLAALSWHLIERRALGFKPRPRPVPRL